MGRMLSGISDGSGSRDGSGSGVETIHTSVKVDGSAYRNRYSRRRLLFAAGVIAGAAGTGLVGHPWNRPLALADYHAYPCELVYHCDSYLHCDLHCDGFDLWAVEVYCDLYTGSVCFERRFYMGGCTV